MQSYNLTCNSLASHDTPWFPSPYFFIFFTRLELEELDLDDEDRVEEDRDDVDREELDPVREMVDLEVEPREEPWETEPLLLEMRWYMRLIAEDGFFDDLDDEYFFAVIALEDG